jgi:DNA recombination protein Rad52
MGFSAKQVQALRRNLDARYVRTREANGRELSYLEGWYVISEANRIFGFDGWSRETVDSRCVLARENRGSFLAVYIARVRITVHAGGATIAREGHGSGEGRSTSPGEVHDIALKAAETDGTKRALATFGKPFGLELYRKDKISPCKAYQRSSGQPQVHQLSRASDYTPTIQHRSRGRRITTGDGIRARRLRFSVWIKKRQTRMLQPLRCSNPQRPPRHMAKSTRANSPSPNLSDCATKPI